MSTIELPVTDQVSLELQEALDTLEELRVERGQLKQQLAVLEEKVEAISRLATIDEARADTAESALRAVTDALDKHQVSVEELSAVAQARSRIDVDVVLKACPDDLLMTLANLDPAMPDVAEVSLSRLRPGSVRLLTTYGICSFTDPNADGAMEVELSDRIWELAALAVTWADSQSSAS